MVSCELGTSLTWGARRSLKLRGGGHGCEVSLRGGEVAQHILALLNGRKGWRGQFLMSEVPLSTAVAGSDFSTSSPC